MRCAGCLLAEAIRIWGDDLPDPVEVIILDYLEPRSFYVLNVERVSEGLFPLPTAVVMHSKVREAFGVLSDPTVSQICQKWALLELEAKRKAKAKI